MKLTRLFAYSLVMSLALAVTALTALTTGAPAPSAIGDWPQWRGANRDGISKETGFAKQWPAAGPASVWAISDIGEGYGSLAIKGDRIYVQGTRGDASVVYSLNRTDGKQVWSTALGPKVNEGRGNGPHSTPTLDGDQMVVLTENGDLACLRLRDGSAVWKKNILKDFNSSNPHWLISESPLVDGNRVIVSPGGKGAGIVALEKMNGNLIWKTADLSDGPAYSSSIAEDVGGVRTVMNFTARGAVGVRANDGKLMWRYDRAANGTANCTTPVFADNKVFFSSAYGTGAALLNLNAQGGEVKSQEVYFTKDMQNHHGGMVLVNGYLYGFSNSILTCLEFATGKKMWAERSVGKGSLTYADGMLFLLGEDQMVGLAEALPNGYKEKGRFPITDLGKPSWAHPVVAGGKLYIRNQNTLTCYDVKAK
ncbi:MAG: PQQ-like beta-propeller repeat protein [Acidobacteriota bacterium]|nr:PQQ-like beta-propeller repeat protein [Acidobacteriota bacterium]